MTVPSLKPIHPIETIDIRAANPLTTRRTVKKAFVGNPHRVVREGLVESTHRKLREMVIALELLPGERLNEATLSKQLGVSSTTLRAAENRLMAEGFLMFSVRRGFIRKPLDVKEILDLYELRQHTEMAAVRLAVERATDKQLLELDHFMQKNTDGSPNRALNEVVLLDEEFHERLVALAGNAEMWNSLRNINHRIRCMRWINMTSDSSECQAPHKEIVRALRDRDTEEGIRLIGVHIELRLGQVLDKVRECYRRINLPADRKIQQDQTLELEQKLRSQISAKTIDAGTDESSQIFPSQHLCTSMPIEAI
jgi:DNA-binding GntR family transcriptional regulator